MGFTNYITQIKDTAVPAVTHDLVDTSASHYVKGTQTASTNVWTGTLPDGITAYADGLTIDYFLPYAGTSSGATLNLGSKGAKPVYVGNGTTQVTTHFPQYSVIHLTYIVNSGLNNGNGAWKATGYYYANQNVFGKVAVGSSTIEADSTRDTLTLEAGNNITLTADTTNDKVTIAASSVVAQELTQTQYDALTSTQKNSDTIYFINDDGLDSEYTIVSDSVPIGAIQAYGGSTAPYGWLICDGSAVSRTTYSALFSVIGTTYGTGNGSTTFNLPDLKGRTLVGVGNSGATGATSHTLGQKAGEETHALNQTELPSHSHTVMLDTDYVSGGATDVHAGSRNDPYCALITAGNWYGWEHNETSRNFGYMPFGYTNNVCGNAAHNNMQPYVVTNYIIKALDHAIDYSNIAQLNASQLALSLVYPVGSVYETKVSSFNPATQWGGTWTKETISEDKVIEEGTSGIWTYRKWSSGIAECWGLTAVKTYTHTTASGYGYYTSDNFAMPSGLFTSVISGFSNRVQGTGTNPSNTLITINGRELTTTNFGIWVQSASSGSQSLSISLYAIGTWKTYAAPVTIYCWTRTA